MLRCCGVTLRTLAIFGFLLAMPLLAIPPVANRVEALLVDAPGLIEELVAIAGGDLAGLTSLPEAPRESDLMAPVLGTSDLATESTAARPSATAPRSLDGAAATVRAAEIDGAAEMVGPPSSPGQETATRSQADGDGPAKPADGELDVQLEVVRQRLNQLGARNFAWDSSAGGYCFQCDVPLADNSVYSKPFEATCDDALSAMQQVETAIIAWHRNSAARRHSSR